MASVEDLENRIGYHFSDRQLLTRALTHSSRSGEDPGVSGNNEQLEFLGDSVLGFVTSEALLHAMPHADEGELSRLKASLVSASHLYRSALVIDLGEYVRLGRGEELTGGRARKSVLADAVEALIAAIYLDGGMEPARRFVRCHLLQPLDAPGDLKSSMQQNHKGILQERALALKLPIPRYVTVDSTGPEHAKQFTVEARIGDAYAARASAASKKAASQEAAELLLQQITEASESKRERAG